jgi:hypothetical protein
MRNNSNSLRTLSSQSFAPLRLHVLRTPLIPPAAAKRGLGAKAPGRFTRRLMTMMVVDYNEAAHSAA